MVQDGDKKLIKSMTGFGKSEERLKLGKVMIEIKTVNHKFFDATLKLPNGIAIFEDKIKEILQKKIKRGKVNLNLSCDGVPLKGGRISINRRVAKNYYNELESLRRHLDLEEGITIKDIIALPGVLNFDSSEEDLISFWPKIKKALDVAIDRLIDNREKEGKALHTDTAYGFRA